MSVVRIFCSRGLFPFKRSYRGIMVSGGIKTILRSHCKDPTNCCVSWSVLMLRQIFIWGGGVHKSL